MCSLLIVNCIIIYYKIYHWQITTFLLYVSRTQVYKLATSCELSEQATHTHTHKRWICIEKNLNQTMITVLLTIAGVCLEYFSMGWGIAPAVIMQCSELCSRDFTLNRQNWPLLFQGLGPRLHDERTWYPNL